jgi:hypothetical protein
MSTQAKEIEYLNTKTFIPHINGNYARYGLNLFLNIIKWMVLSECKIQMM